MSTFKVLKTFPFSPDGIRSKTAMVNTTRNDIPQDLVDGLVKAGYLAPLEGKAAGGAPQNKAMGKAPENKSEGPVEIPEGWQDLPWNELRALGIKLDAALVNGKKADIVTAIEAELARRAEKPDA